MKILQNLWNLLLRICLLKMQFETFLCWSFRSLSTGRLSDMLLKAAFGANLLEEESDESFGTDRSMDIPGTRAGSWLFIHQKVPLHITLLYE